MAETIIIGLEAKVLTAYTFIESQFEIRDPLKSDLWIEPFIADKREWVKEWGFRMMCTTKIWRFWGILTS